MDARSLTAVAAILLVAGLGCRAKFTYRHGTPLVPEPRFKHRIVVLPFADQTGAPGHSSDPLRSIGTVNLAKRPWKNLSSSMPHLTGDILGRALAAELLHSGLFASVKFRKKLPKGTEPVVIVTGDIRLAEFSNRKKEPSSLELVFAVRTFFHPSSKTLWEGAIHRTAKGFPGSAAEDHGKLNQVMQKAFGDIRRQAASALDARGFGDTAADGQ